MSPQFQNQAAFIAEARARPLKVGPGPTPNPADNEVVIKVNYAAINPTDYKTQDNPYFELPYPWIAGTDVAGTVVQLGTGVKRFEIGQRVIGHCDSLLTRKHTNSGFQLYSTCQEILTAAIPDSLPLANAAVLPLAVSTAASGLFHQLEMPYPCLTPKPTGKQILIWGGSSSCGCVAIQLAVAAGFEVVTTASKANFGFVKEMGAKTAFDHRDADVVEKILEVMKPGNLVLDCIGLEDTQKMCTQIVSQLGGGKMPSLLWPTGQYAENVEAVLVNGLDPGLVNLDVGDAIWRKYLPAALDAGTFKTKPDPVVIKGGLEKVQDGIDMLREGVSAKKVVVEIVPEETK